MAYERTNWQNGDVISSEKLNKMEAGIEYACSLEHEVEDPTEGQVLKYDAEKKKFVNSDVPAAIETNIQNPTDGQTLKYDAASGKWVNGEGGSGSGSEKVVVHITTTEDDNNYIYTADKTWQEIHDSYPNVILEITSASGIVFHKTINGTMHGDGLYGLDIAYPSDSVQIYETDVETGYPIYSVNSK